MTKKPKSMTTILIIIAVVLVAFLVWFVMNVKVMRYGPLKITIWQKILVKGGMLIIDYDRVSNTFSCPVMPGVSFRYSLSEDWSVGEKSTEIIVDHGCRVPLSQKEGSMSSIPYMYVTNILVDGLTDFTKLPVNPHGIHYAIEQLGGSWASEEVTPHDFGKTIDFYFDGKVIRVDLLLPAEEGKKGVKPLDRELFFKSVIESFQITPSSLSGTISKEQAIEIAKQDVLKDHDEATLSKYTVVVGESKAGWAISFKKKEWAERGGGLPMYIIDAWDGKVYSKFIQPKYNDMYSEVVQASSSAPTTVDGVTYVQKNLYRDGDNTVSYIQVVGGIQKDIQDKINTSLTPYSCLSDETEMRQDLTRKYDDINPKPDFSKGDIAQMNAQTLREKLAEFFSYEEMYNQEVLYLDHHLLSVSSTVTNYCGGPYPNSGLVDTYNFDVTTGERIYFKDIFKNFEKDRGDILKIVMHGVKEKYGEQDKECILSENDIGYMPFGFTKKGIDIVSLGYNHAMHACEPGDFVIPFSLLAPYLNTTTHFMKSVNLEEK